MDAVEKWFWEQASTPTGSILLFLLVFLSRVAIDQWTHHRRVRKAKKRPKVKVVG